MSVNNFSGHEIFVFKNIKVFLWDILKMASADIFLSIKYLCLEIFKVFLWYILQMISADICLEH